MGELYGGLDVSDKLTHLCVRDGAGALVWRGRCASDLEVIAATLRNRRQGWVGHLWQGRFASCALDG